MNKLLNPIEIRQHIHKIMQSAPNATVSDGLLGAAVGLLSAAMQQEGTLLTQDDTGSYKRKTVSMKDQNRHRVLGFLFGDETKPFEEGHFHALTTIQKYALYRWVKPEKPSDEAGWIARDSFITEARWILTEANRIWEESKMQKWKDNAAPAFADFLAEMEYRYQQQGLNSVLDSGGWVAEGLKQGGQIAMSFDQDYDNVTGQPLCDWCNERPAAQNEPCAACAELGAKAENNPKKKPWPQRKPAAIDSEKVQAALAYCHKHMDKIVGMATFHDHNAVQLRVAFDNYIREQSEQNAICLINCQRTFEKVDALY